MGNPDWRIGKVFMQYTGLKDKHGKEIYEGDILEHRYTLFKNQPEIVSVLVVSYRQDGFYALNPKDTDNSPALGKLRYCLNHEVIGNIYENPELLGE